MDEIQFTIGIGIKAPIAEGTYKVGDFDVVVSYPPSFDLGTGLHPLPKGLSTVFSVRWTNGSAQDIAWLSGGTYHRHLVIHRPLSAINELLQAYKLVRLGHIDSCGVRSIGLYDTLFHFSAINGVPTGFLNVGLKSHWQDPSSEDPHDPFGTTALALPHIATNTLPVARRFLRCYELLEHGFYSEAFIIAFSILDDLTQDMLHTQLLAKGMNSKSDRDALMRGIKENRLKLYLGPVLKITSGTTISELWSMAEKALEWLNKIRNNIAHGGFGANYHSAAVGIYACIKLLHTMHSSNLMLAEFPVHFFRHAKITASWTQSPPDWVPTGTKAESMDFDS